MGVYGNKALHEEYSLEKIEKLLEGANINITVLFAKHTKVYMGYIINCRRYMNDKDYHSAAKELEKARREIEYMRTALDEMGSDIGSDIFGILSGSALLVAKEIFGLAAVIGLGVYGVELTMKANYELFGDPETYASEVLGKLGKKVSIGSTVLSSLLVLKDSMHVVSEYRRAKKLGVPTADRFNYYRIELASLLKKLSDVMIVMEKELLFKK